MKEERKEFLKGFIENTKCESCPIIKECDKYEDLQGETTGKYENLCDVFTKILNVEDLE